MVVTMETAVVKISFSEPDQMQEMPENIDRDALGILREAGFRWDGELAAFRRGRARLDYAFLREQKLIVGATMSAQERTGQLQRLRILVQSLE